MKHCALFLLSFCILVAKCQPDIKKLRCIEATSIFPVFAGNGQIVKYDTGTIKVYYRGSKRLYDLPYVYTYTKNGETKVSEVRRHFVAFEIDSAFGYDVHISSGVIKRVNIDSVFQFIWLKKNKLYPIITENIVLVTDSKRNSDSGTLVEKYLIKSKIDSSNLGVCTFSYTNKITGFDISLSKELDSIIKMKLCDAHLIIFSRYFKESNQTMDRYEISYSLKENIIIDEKNILSLFKTLHIN
jgi:hypothetical protein